MGGLAAPCRTIAFDLRGFGESTVRGQFSMDQWADDVAGALAALGVDQAVIAGLSMGGYVAFSLWRRHSSLVRALVLADTRAGVDDETARDRWRERIRLVADKGAGVVVDAMIQRMVGKTTRKKQSDLVEAIHRMISLAPAFGAAGGDDALTPPHVACAMHDAIRGSWLEIFAGAGHVSNVELPASSITC